MAKTENRFGLTLRAIRLGWHECHLGCWLKIYFNKDSHIVVWFCPKDQKVPNTKDKEHIVWWESKDDFQTNLSANEKSLKHFSNSKVLSRIKKVKKPFSLTLDDNGDLI